MVFCDTCSTAYHQHCHKPAISNQVVTVVEKEWLCGPCQLVKETVVSGTKGLVAVEGLSIDEACPILLQTLYALTIARNAHTFLPDRLPKY
jgi:hypothetical protein